MVNLFLENMKENFLLNYEGLYGETILNTHCKTISPLTL